VLITAIPCYNTAHDADDDENAIVLAVANRTPIKDIARAYDLSIKEVDAIIDRRATEMFDGGSQRRQI
jgi:hypothetical protein